MLKKNITLIAILLVAFNLFGVFDDYEPSPRARAMGGAYYTTSNEADAIFYNPAGLNLAETNLMGSYTKPFSNDFQVVNTLAFTTALPGKFGNIGIGVQSMDVEWQDVELMSERVYALSHAFALLEDVHSSIFLGYTANLYHLSMHELGSETAFGLNLGALAILHARTRLAFSVSNLNNPKLGEDNSQELPQKLAGGISYEPYSGVITALELKKTINNKTKSDTEIHVGTEIKVVDPLTLRFGVRNHPNSYSMGARFSLYNVCLDYAFNTHVTGNTHHFGLGYNF
ncbi:MAG TPA: hypothetical protein DHM37_01780 [Candidatus Cloacimonas sp.]|jgi:hypothetical protein|nr:hypothetical protein [Candidatus Cloacimonadota bacterium]HCX72424.1 hypothetical protein [Candidatus Cloacimonas sp.]